MSVLISKKQLIMAEEEGFEPSVQVSSHGHLANDWFQPLTHSSFDKILFYKTYLNISIRN
jgi:hypothetical protein